MGGKSADPAGFIENTQQGTGRTTGTTNAATTTTIPDFLRPFLTQSTNTAQGALGQLRSLSRGNLVADFNPDQMSAFDQVRGFGTSDPFQSALNAMQSTAQGDFLYGGPGQQAFVDAAMRSASPGIISQFGGRGGSGLAQASIGQSAVDASARLFDSERNRQMQAAGALPGLAMTPIDMLLQTGGMQQQHAQQRISAPIAAQQDLLSAALSGLPVSGLLGRTQTGSTTGTSTNTVAQQSPYYEPPTGASVLGGALGGLRLGASVGGPFGAALGGIGGGLLGLL